MSAAVLLMSGGLDSTTCLYLLRGEGVRVIALGINYGQAHAEELRNAERICATAGVPFHTKTLPPLSPIPGYANVYPGRNLILLAHAASHAATHDASNVVIGCNADDARDYEDCRPGFLNAARLVMPSTIGLRAPLLDLTKTGVVKLASSLDVPIEKTRSCYGPGIPCGRCAACQLRNRSLSQ